MGGECRSAGVIAGIRPPVFSFAPRCGARGYHLHGGFERRRGYLRETLAEGLRIHGERRTPMSKFILWLLLLFVCWPLALLALVAYPFVWLLTIPFRLVGITVDGVLELVRLLIMLPARILGVQPRTRN
jgi:hypothetical protein